MKAAVLGAGAMGGLFGARLALAGEEVVLIEVSEAQIAAVSAYGVRLVDDHGERAVPIPIGRAEAFEGPVDLILVFTKGPHTLAAVGSVLHLVGPATRVLSLQNGLGNGERIAGLVSPERVMVGVTNWPADLRAPGVVASHGDGEVRLWSLQSAGDPHVSAVCEALDRAGLNCVADAQVEAAIWEKVAFNAAMNSVAGVTGFTVGQMADSPELCAIQDAVLAETVAVARAEGVGVDAGRIRAAVLHARAEHRGHQPSMLQDLNAGRPTEIDAINLAIAERARARNLEAPVTETLGRLIKAIERRPAVRA